MCLCLTVYLSIVCHQKMMIFLLLEKLWFHQREKLEIIIISLSPGWIFRYWSVRMSVSLSGWLFIYCLWSENDERHTAVPVIHLSVCPPVRLCVHLSFVRSRWRDIFLFVCPPICLFFSPSDCLSFACPQQMLWGHISYCLVIGYLFVIVALSVRYVIY